MGWGGREIEKNSAWQVLFPAKFPEIPLTGISEITSLIIPDFENQQTKILLRALKLPRLLRVSRLLIFLNRSKYKTIFKILRLFFVLFLAAHWGGCLFFWLCELQTPEIQFGVSSTLLNRDTLNDPLTVQPAQCPLEHVKIMVFRATVAFEKTWTRQMVVFHLCFLHDALWRKHWPNYYRK